MVGDSLAMAGAVGGHRSCPSTDTGLGSPPIRRAPSLPKWGGVSGSALVLVPVRG